MYGVSVLRITAIQKIKHPSLSKNEPLEGCFFDVKPSIESYLLRKKTLLGLGFKIALSDQ
jgi:hypothetical protein